MMLLTFVAFWEGKNDDEHGNHVPYQDVAGVWTVCYGETSVEMRVYTEIECKAMLERRLRYFNQVVTELVTVPLNTTEQIALTSFVYNIGEGAFRNSTLLRKLNAGDRSGACEELRRWVFAGGKKWAGLVNRREAEQILCEGL